MIIPVITHFGTAQILFQGMHFMPFVLTECTGLCSGSAPSLHWFCCAGRTLQLLSNLQPQEEEEEDLDFPFQGDLNLPFQGNLCTASTFPWPLRVDFVSRCAVPDSVAPLIPEQRENSPWIYFPVPRVSAHTINAL